MEGTRTVKFEAKFCKKNASYRWYQNKIEIFKSHKFNMEVDGDMYMLTISRIDMADAGKYYLKCGNNEAQTSAWLYVEREYSPAYLRFE